MDIAITIAKIIALAELLCLRRIPVQASEVGVSVAGIVKIKDNATVSDLERLSAAVLRLLYSTLLLTIMSSRTEVERPKSPRLASIGAMCKLLRRLGQDLPMLFEEGTFVITCWDGLRNTPVVRI